MKIIRSKDSALWIPKNPEGKSENQSVQLVEPNRYALVPDDFKSGDFEVIQKVVITNKKKSK